MRHLRHLQNNEQLPVKQMFFCCFTFFVNRFVFFFSITAWLQAIDKPSLAKPHLTALRPSKGVVMKIYLGRRVHAPKPTYPQIYFLLGFRLLNFENV